MHVHNSMTLTAIPQETCVNGAVRLITPGGGFVIPDPSFSQAAGLVQVCQDYKWRFVCGAYWNTLSTRFFCQELLFETGK